MLRLLALTSLTGVLSLATANRAEAEVCRSDLDVAEELGSSALLRSELPPSTVERAPSRAPLEPSPAPLAWCETPDDPRCAPASPASEGPHAGGAVLAVLPRLAELAPPRGADVSLPRIAERSPREGVRGLVDRPPR